MTTRNTTTARTIFNLANEKAVAAYSQWQGEFSAVEKAEYEAACKTITWQGGAQQGRTIYNVGKKEVRPGLWEMYVGRHEFGYHSLRRYSGVFTTEAAQAFIEAWHLKYNG